MTYIECVNAAIRERAGSSERLVCFGQNITKGSCLSGLTRALPGDGGRELIDTPNCENALAAFGFGMMLEGQDSIFFVKQLDFLLLALDQLVNTWNMARQAGARGSFTIVAVVVDSGFEGPQSRLNNLSDFCSLADLPGFAVGDSSVARPLVERHLIAPGFRILAVSQRLFRAPAEAEAEACDDAGELFRLAAGGDATLAAFNFAWPQARALRTQLAARGIEAELFGVADASPARWDVLLESVARTGRLVLLDDSRARHRPADALRAALADAGLAAAVLPLYRAVTADDIRPNADLYQVDAEAALRWLQDTGPGKRARSA